MNRSGKKIVVVIFGAALSVAAVWMLDAAVAFVLKFWGVSEDQIAVWQPQILFASFAVVLLGTCVLLSALVRPKRKVVSS